MKYLLLLILHDTSLLTELLEAWKEVGVPGSTIIKSAGGHRARTWLGRVGAGYIDRLFENREVQSRIIIAALDSEEMLEIAIAEAERITGGFDQPNSGLLMAWPITHAIGLRKPEVEEELPEDLPPALRPDWKKLRNTPIEEVDLISHLQPTTVRPDMPLEEVAGAMMAHSDVHVACVVAEDGRLMGLISLKSLADDLYFHIVPEEFIAESIDLEKMMDFADKSRIRTAKDAMSAPVWVKRGETVKDAFLRMHENDLPGLPVVDDRYHVTGYINLLELSALCFNRGLISDMPTTNDVEK